MVVVGPLDPPVVRALSRVPGVEKEKVTARRLHILTRRQGF